MGLTFHEESWVIIFLTNILMPKKDSKNTQSVDDLLTIVTTVKKNYPGIAVVLFYFALLRFQKTCATFSVVRH